MRILIVDDHPTVRQDLRHALSDEFREVTWAEAGTVAQTADLVARARLDLLIISVALADGGLEALRRVRAINEKLPVLMITITEQDDEARELFDEGASGYIGTDRPPDDLHDAVRTLLHGGQFGAHVPPEKIVRRRPSARSVTPK